MQKLAHAGAQIGMVAKVDKAADSALEIGARTLEKVFDKWSSLCLIGYAGQWALGTTVTGTQLTKFLLFGLCQSPYNRRSQVDSY